MKRALALAFILGAGIGVASTVVVQQAESTTAHWANACETNDLDGGMHITMQGVVSAPDGGGVNVPVISVLCQGPAAFASISTCFQAWKDANGIP